MNTYERDAFSFSPGKGMNLPFENFGLGAGFIQQFASNAMRANLEAAGFASRRARATMELPGRLAQCKTVQEAAAAQMQYWNSAWSEATLCGQRVLGIWMQAAKPDSRSNGFTRMAEAASEAMTKPIREAMDVAKGEQAALWEWWRTDMKGIVPRRNGYAEHVREAGEGH